MKKLYRKSTAAVHPVSDYLPAAILALAVGLPAEDKEVLAYLISCSFSKTQKQILTKHNHSPVFTCSCFHCYMNYWVKWDTSQNRDRIHHILDQYEDALALSLDNNNNNNNNNNTSISTSSKRDRKKRKGKAVVLVNNPTQEVPEIEPGNESLVYGEDETEKVEEEEEKINVEKGSMRKFVSFLGDTFWAVWT